MRIPIATYRLQFNPDFGFADAREIVDYLAALGISDIYASPVFKARQGSMHGYDVVDQAQLNPELGHPDEFDQLIDNLHQHEMGWLQDIVPNHMAYDGQNHYLMDVLEHGPNSPYFQYFDIEWDNGHEELKGKVLAPLLGDFYDRCLERGEIQLAYDESGLNVRYYGLKFPTRIESYATFLSHDVNRLTQQLDPEDRSYIKVSGILHLAQTAASGLSGQQRRDQTIFVKQLLWELYQSNADVRDFIDQNLVAFNGQAGDPDSFKLLDELLSEQFYRLAFWKVGAEELNYRRFFTVNELICLKVDDPEVFEQTHSLIIQLVQSQKVNGVRIDHIDGLYDPTEYLNRLRQILNDAYIVVEKILEMDETLPEHWPIQGTSGYEFLNYVNGVFCQQSSQDQFTQIYHRLTGQTTPYAQLVADKKRLIAETNLVGDIDNLARFLKRVCSQYRYGRDLTLYGLRTAIEEVLIAFPIYCTYANRDGISRRDLDYVRTAIETARKQIPQLINELNLVEKFLSLEYEDSLPEEEREQWLHFVMRLQQFTGPIMAKGVEDTLFYGYNRFISLNEVGGSPGHFGVSLRQFHQFNEQQQAQWPLALNTTSTHDTKRSEDVRARLNVLSEMPEAWEAQVNIWRSINSHHKRVAHDQVVPDTNDEYFLYQTLIGAFPFNRDELPEFTERVVNYVVKAVREAKVHTAWLRPDTEYEEGFVTFTRAILSPEKENLFLDKFLSFQQQIANYGIYNSLSQALLKMSLPGIPDFYQGNELWDFSLVDPDNRRPVDYAYRQGILNHLREAWAGDKEWLMKDLLDYRQDGRIKMFLLMRGLAARQQYPELFQQGDYQPLNFRGQFEDNGVAFARRWQGQRVVAIAPRFFSQLAQVGEYPIGKIWGNTTLALPGKAVTWYDWLSDRTLTLSAETKLSQLLKSFPVALLTSEVG